MTKYETDPDALLDRAWQLSVKGKKSLYAIAMQIAVQDKIGHDQSVKQLTEVLTDGTFWQNNNSGLQFGKRGDFYWRRPNGEEIRWSPVKPVWWDDAVNELRQGNPE